MVKARSLKGIFLDTKSYFTYYIVGSQRFRIDANCELLAFLASITSPLIQL